MGSSSLPKKVKTDHNLPFFSMTKYYVGTITLRSRNISVETERVLVIVVRDTGKEVERWRGQIKGESEERRRDKGEDRKEEEEVN